MGGKPDTANLARRLHFLYVIKNTRAEHLVKILVLVYAVKKTEIGIICTQLTELPFKGFLYFVKIP